MIIIWTGRGTFEHNNYQIHCCMSHNKNMWFRFLPLKMCKHLADDTELAMSESHSKLKTKRLCFDERLAIHIREIGNKPGILTFSKENKQ